MKITVLLRAIIARNFFLKYNTYNIHPSGLLSEIKFSTTIHKIYQDGGRKLARTGMRKKLFILHGLMEIYYFYPIRPKSYINVYIKKNTTLLFLSPVVTMYLT